MLAQSELTLLAPSAEKQKRDKPHLALLLHRSRRLIQEAQSSGEDLPSDRCSAFVRSISLATPTSLLRARKALTARPRRLQVRCTR